MKKSNPYITTLNRFRKAVRKVRTKRFFSELADESESMRRRPYGAPFRRIMALPDATDDVIIPSVATHLGDRNYFAPLLEPLAHLSIDKGWRLDGVLRGSHFASVFDLQATDGKTREFPFAHHIHLDGSAESLWEAHILRIWGDLLYRGWHAGYGDFRIVTAFDTLAAETQGMSTDIILPIKKVFEEIGERSRELERWDFAPTVKVNDTQGTVTFCIYSPFGGFKKIKETLRFAPFERIAMETVAEIPYECGVYF